MLQQQLLRSRAVLKAKMLILAFYLSSCALMPQKSGEIPANYFEGPANATISADKYRDALTRGTYSGIVVDGSIAYTGEATFLSDPYIEARARDLGRNALKSEEEIQLDIKNDRAAYVDHKSCFLVEIATSDPSTAKLALWEFKLEQDQVTSLQPEKTGIGGDLIKTTGDNVRPFGNTTVACAGGKLKQRKPFKIHLIPKFGSGEYGRKTLEWVPAAN